MRKYFNILLVLVVVLAVSMVACKKAPTAVANFSTEEVSPPPAPSDEVKNETVKPEDTIEFIIQADRNLMLAVKFATIQRL